MSASHIAYAIVFYIIASGLTDWFFFGILFHKKYSAYPEVWWRSQGAPGESKAIAWSSFFSLFTIAGFIAACSFFSINGYKSAFQLAGLIWLIGPLPLTITNSLFIKMHRLIVVSHSLGWLARLLIAASAVSCLLS